MAKFLKLSLGKKAEPDDDLDIPDFEFGNPDTKDDRTPAAKIALSAKQGFTNALTDRENLKKKLKENLPNEYGEAADFVSNSVTETKDFIDHSVKSLKPAAKNIAKSVKMFLPPGMSRLQERLDRIEKWADDEQNKGPSVEAQRDQEIGIGIGRIFQQQALQDEVKEAKEDAKDKVNQAIEFGRHKDQVAILNAISKAVTGTNNYTTRVNSEWQKKSLELQYRLLFATRDILEVNTKSYEDTKTLLANIQKNTALPEFQKLRLNERFMEQSRNKFIGKGLDTVSGYGKRVVGNVKRQIQASIDTVNDMSSMLATGADMAKMMEDFEGKKTMGQHAGGAAGGWLANILMDVMIGKGGAKLREDPKRLDKFAKVTNRLGYLLGNKDRLLQNLENIDEDDPNIFKRGAGKFMRTFSGSQAIDTSMRRMGVDEMQQGGVFTNRVAKSITDIIPGYLAKILREITVLRTGDEKTGLLTYDHKRDKFIKEKTLVRLNKRQFEKGNKAVEDKIKPILSVVESNTKLNDAERSQFVRFLMDYSMQGGLFNFAIFSKPSLYKGKLTPELAEKVAGAFKAHTDSIGTDGSEYHRQNRRLSESFNSIGASMTTSAKDAQDLVTFGQEHIARKAGMINQYGSYNLDGQKNHVASRISAAGPLAPRSQEDIDKDNMRDTEASDYDAEERQQTNLDKSKELESDILAKENIKTTKKGGLLDKLRKLKLYDWNYKPSAKTKDGGKPHTGPMAQNVNDILGSSFAPGGTKIDMANMNGFLTGATQELDDKITNLEGSINKGGDKGTVPENTLNYSIKLTEQIRDNTAKIAAGTLLSLRFMGNLDLSKLNLSKIDLNALVKGSKEKLGVGIDKLKDKARWGYDYAKDGSILSHVHGLLNAGLGIGESVTGLGTKAYGKLKAAGQDIYGRVKTGANWIKKNPLAAAGNWLKDKHQEAKNAYDVFVKPEDAPRMTSKKIQRGDYFDSTDSTKPLKTKEEIENTKGDILDSKTGQVVIYIGEIDDIYFRQTSIGKVIKAARRLKDNVMGAARTIRGFVPVAYTFAWNTAKGAYKTALNWIEGPTDVYVKGEEVPRLFKHAMIAGKYIRASDSKVIERPSQIDGMVYDMNQEVVLSAQDFAKGIVNSKGQPFTGPVKKILSKAKDLANFARTKLIGGGKQALAALKKVGQGAARIAKHGLTGAAQVVGTGIGAMSFEGIDILRSIRDILDARLPGGGGIGVGGVKHDENGNEIAGPAAPRNNTKNSLLSSIKSYSSGNPLDAVSGLASAAGRGIGGLWNKFKGKAEKAKADFEESEAGQKVKDLKDKTKAGIEKLRKTSIADKIKAKKDKLMEKMTAGKEAVKGRIGSWQNMKERENVNKSDHNKELNEVKKYEIKNTFDLIGDMIKKIKNGIGGLFGGGDDDGIDVDIGGDGKKRRRRRGRGRMKGRMGRMGRGAGRLLGGAGRLAGSALGGVGRVAMSGAGLAGRALMSTGGLVGRGALMAAGMVPGLASAAGAAGSALLSGAGAVLGSISLPVVAGVLAVGALAYGGYKLYQYLTKKKWNDTEILRMMEYGLRGGDEEAFKKIYALEKMLTDAATVTETDVTIDNKKVKAEEVYKIFGIDPASNDDEQVQRKQMFDVWYEQRFSPIFYKWLKAVQKTYGDKSLDKLESAPEKQYAVVKETSTDNTGWLVSNSPFNLQNLNTDTNIISQFRKAVMDKLSKDAKIDGNDKKDMAKVEGASPEVAKAVSAGAASGIATNSKDVSGASETASSKMMSALKTAFGYTPLGLMATGISKAVGAGAWFADKVSGAGGLKMAFTSPSEFFSNVFSKSVSALEAIKMRAYGLGNMETSKVNTLRKLEELLINETKFGSDGTITWDGDLQVLAGGARKLFGIGDQDIPENKALLEYLSKRFIPTYLIFYTGMNSVIGKADIKALRDVMDVISPTTAIDIGNRLVGSRDIWNVTDSPWRDYKLLTNAEAVKENLAFLSQKAKSETMPEQKKVESKGLIPTASAATIPEKVNTSAAQSAQAQFFKPPEPEASPDAEGKEIGGGSSGGKPVDNATGGAVQGRLVMAGGELVNGSGASKFITLKGGANIANMNPDFMKLFNGMVEEYGQKTGKTVQVNSGWRSMAAQAELYAKMPKGRAAKPGSSLHEFGLAMDINSADLDAMDKMGLLRKYGFTRPVAKEPWHIEPVGINSPELLAAAKKDPSVAKSAIEAGIGRGGGGVGDTQRNASSYYRDWKAHNAIFNSSVPPSKEDTEKLLAGLPDTGYNSSVEKLKKNQVQLPSQGNTGGNLTSSPEAEGKAGSSTLGGGSSSTSTAAASGIEAPQGGFKGNADNLDTLKEAGGSGGKTWKDLPNNNGASWQAQGTMIQEAAKWVGIDPGLAAAVAAKESGFNPTSMSREAGPNAARGMYQFKPDTFNEMVKKYGSKYGITAQNANIMDPRQSALMGMHYVKQGMSSAGGKSAGWAYLTHFLGQGGNLEKFKSMGDSDIPAKVLSGPAAANKAVFYHGGDLSRPRTKAELIAYCDNEMKRKLTEFKVPLSLETGATVQPSGSVPSTGSVADTASVTPLAQVPAVDNSNPEMRPETRPQSKPSSGFGRFNTPTTEQVVAANQPIQRGTDPARDVNLMDETNQILGRQLDVLVEVRDLIGQLVSNYSSGNVDSEAKVEPTAAKTNEPSKVRQRDTPVTTMSKPMVSRARTTIV